MMASLPSRTNYGSVHSGEVQGLNLFLVKSEYCFMQGTGLFG
jgi:hypothetical protein